MASDYETTQDFYRAMSEHTPTLIDRIDGLGNAAAKQPAIYRLLQDCKRALEQHDALVTALREMTEDLEARWDMNDRGTNPGIKDCVEQAHKVLALVEPPR